MRFRPMLAGTAKTYDQLLYPLYASPKYDGIRAIVIGGVVMSRKLLPIPNKHVQRLFGRSVYEGLDGELIIGDPTAPDCYRKTDSGVMRIEGEPEVKFYVFDDARLSVREKAFNDRYYRLKSSKGRYGNRVVIVPQVEIKRPTQLIEYEERMVSEGYEGVMTRSYSGPYKHGRSTAREQFLLKVKRFLDAEAKIIGYEEMQHNMNTATKDNLGRTKRSSAKAGKVQSGVLGALLVKPKNGVEFSIGGGFTAEERKTLWKIREKLIGKMVKYKYFPTGNKERPRFPTFLGFRSKIDA